VSQPSFLVFDVGDVLVPSGDVLPVLASELGITVDELWAAYWRERRAFDLGGDEDTYWTSILAELGREPDPALVRRLSALDSRKWGTLPPSGASLLAGLDGRRLGLLSNAPAPLAAGVRASSWSAAFEVLAFSAELGLAKPDPEIYARADELFGTAPGDVLFFDDRQDNVAAAREHGWSAVRWTDGMSAQDVLIAADQLS